MCRERTVQRADSYEDWPRSSDSAIAGSKRMFWMAVFLPRQGYESHHGSNWNVCSGEDAGGACATVLATRKTRTPPGSETYDTATIAWESELPERT